LSAADTFPSQVPVGPSAPGRQKPGDVRHVASADQDAAAVGRIAKQFGDPANRFQLDFGGDRSDVPGSRIGIDGSGQKIAEHADGSRR